MRARKPCAPEFYSGDCPRQIRSFLEGFTAPADPPQAVAGVVPHAGWVYSGAVAAKVFGSIQRKQSPATFVIFGAVHRGIPGNAVYARGAWATPLGDVEIDAELAQAILERTAGLLADVPEAHNGEHAIEVQLPFLKFLFPKAKFVPVSVLPDPEAKRLGTVVGEYLKESGYPAVVIGSTDLTHYGDAYGFVPAGHGPPAERWVHDNDARILRLAREMRAAEIPGEARARQNACGAGALAATAMGASRGHLLEYKTSHDAAPEEPFRMAVGYAGMLF